LAPAGIIVSAVGLSVALVSAWFAREHFRLASGRRERDFEATVVVELTDCHEDEDDRLYEIVVKNAGPAVARDISVELVAWRSGPFGETIHHVDLAPALNPGEQRPATLRLPLQVDLDDPSQSIEIVTDYFDDNGVRNERLAFVTSSDLILTPPQPPMSFAR
jgi:hypothetical protein